MANETRTEAQTAQPAPIAAAGGAVLGEVLAETKIKPNDEAYAIARIGVGEVMKRMLEPSHAAEKVDRFVVDAMIAELDKRMSAQVNEVLHHPDLQKLESAWRSLRFVVERVDFRENIRVEIFNTDKESLQADLDDAPDLTKSG